MEPVGQGQCEWIITDYHRGRLHKHASTVKQNICKSFRGGQSCPLENFGGLWQDVRGKKRTPWSKDFLDQDQKTDKTALFVDEE